MMNALVVDDDMSIARLVRSHLEKQGFTVTTGENGQEALALVKTQKFDLIVMDWEMPELNGIETIKILRADPATAKIPVIMLTGKDAPEEIMAGWTTGANVYLAKPYKPADFRWAVEHVFSVSEEKAIPMPAVSPPEPTA